MALFIPHFSLHTIKRYLPLFILLIFSCKKETTSISCTPIETNITSDLTSITAFHDTLFITGNKSYKGQLIYSADNGQSWKMAGEFPHGLNNFTIYKNKWIAAADSFNIYLSENAGQTWTELWIQGTISMEYITDIHSITSVNDRLYICGGNELGLGFTGVSTDGNHWTFFQTDHELKSVIFSDEQHGISCGYGIIYFTNDGGLTWTSAEQKDEFWTTACYSKGYYFASSYSGKVISSSKGENWNTIREGGGIFNNAVQINNSSAFGEIIIGAGLNGKGIYSQDFGNNWKNIIFAEDFHIYSIHCMNEHEGLIAGENGRLYKIVY